MISLAIIEDDPLYSKRLRELFEAAPDVEVVSYCASVDEALSKISGQKPDVVLVDVYLENGEFGYEAISPLKDKLPEAEFVMLTRTGDYDRIFTSIVAGANGYLLKTEPDEEILGAVRVMHSHGSVMTTSIARKVMQVFRDMAEQQRHQSATALTTKENEILELVERGRQYKEVALHMDTSVRTIHSHVRNIYQKLQASNKSEALRKWRILRGPGGEIT